MSARFRSDEAGVSEVLGYTLSLFISFLLLTVSLFAFKIVADEANERAASVLFRDVGNRVAGAALEGLSIGANRAGSTSDAPSTLLTFSKVLEVSPRAHGREYRVTLSGSTVTVVSTDGVVSETVGLFTPPISSCSASVGVCQFLGTASSGAGQILLKYEFNPDPAATHATCTTNPINCVTIS